MELLRVKFIGNLPGKAPERTLLIALDADYCDACIALRSCLAESNDTFWVRKKYHFAWLRAFIEYTGINHLRPVNFTETSPRDILEQSWGATIPDWLTDELILKEQLLDTKLPPGTHAGVDAALLAPLFGELGSKFPWSQAGPLAEKASGSASQTQLASNTIIRLAWEDTLGTWANSNEPSWAGEFCERLRAAPAKLWRDLTIWRLLCDYPEAEQEFALDPAAATFVRSVPAESLKRMSMNPEGRALAVDQIQPFFEREGAGVVSRPKFETLAGAVSGELKEEFTALESILERAQFKIEQGDVESIARCFAHCAEINVADLSKFQLLVKPPRPDIINTESADAAAWKKWFHAEYLPFRWWQTERGEADADVEEVVGKFSAWCCRDFIQVHSDPALSAVQTLAQWRSLILNDSVSLILLVDNLPWFFWDSFERALVGPDFTSTSPMIALLRFRATRRCASRR